MRIAAIGCALDHPRVEPVAFRSRTSLLDYDLVLWNPSALFEEYAADIERPGDPPVLSVPASDAILEEARRRREDMRRFVGRGRCLVVSPPAPAVIRMHTLEEIVDFGALEALPVHDVATEALAPTAARSSSGEPFKSFYAQVADMIRPRAALTSFPGAAFLQADGCDAVVGAYAYRHPGHLLLTPFPVLDAPRNGLVAERAFVDALVTLVRRLTAPTLTVDLPAWADACRLPQEAAAGEELAALWAAHDALTARIQRAEQRRRDFMLRKAVFAGRGRVALHATASLLRDAGFAVLQGALSDESLVAERDARALVVLLAAPEADRVGEDAVDALAGLAADARAMFGGQTAGLLVANPRPSAPLAERPEPPLTPAACARARRLGFGWASGAALTALLSDGADNAAAAARLFDIAEGRADPPDWRHVIRLQRSGR